MYKRTEYNVISSRIREPRKFIQVLMGPRQVGKSTVVKQVLHDLDRPYLFYSADNVPVSNQTWLSECWAAARAMMASAALPEIVLVVDEIQKVTNWSEVVKKEWDADTFNDCCVKVLLLGSSRVMIEHGLSESLAGRFEEIRMTHWSYPEMHDAFGLTLQQYIYYGGYPGAITLIDDRDRLNQYIQSAIIDSTINKDILLDTPVGKPALLRQTFELSAAYSGQIVSLNKMVGALTDAGNTTTLASYVNLLNDSGLVCGLQKFSVDFVRRRASIPKFQVYNNALKTVFLPASFEQAGVDPRLWGNIQESAVGTHIVNQAFKHRLEVFYWRDGNDEVDFVVRKNQSVLAIEVKSNREADTAGLRRFTEMYAPTRAFIVGDAGIPTEQFLSTDLRSLL